MYSMLLYSPFLIASNKTWNQLLLKESTDGFLVTLEELQSFSLINCGQESWF